MYQGQLVQSTAAYRKQEDKHYPVSLSRFNIQGVSPVHAWRILSLWMNLACDEVAQDTVTATRRDWRHRVASTSHSSSLVPVIMSPQQCINDRTLTHTVEEKIMNEQMFGHQLSIHSMGILLLFIATQKRGEPVNALQGLGSAAMMVAEQQLGDVFSDRFVYLPNECAWLYAELRNLKLPRSHLGKTESHYKLAAYYSLITNGKYSYKTIIKMVNRLVLADTTTMSYQHSYTWMAYLHEALDESLVKTEDKLLHHCMLVLRAGLTYLPIALEKPLHVALAAFVVATDFDLHFALRRLDFFFPEQNEAIVTRVANMLRAYLNKYYQEIVRNLPEIKCMTEKLGLKEHAQLEDKKEVETVPSVGKPKVIRPALSASAPKLQQHRWLKGSSNAALWSVLCLWINKVAHEASLCVLGEKSEGHKDAADAEYREALLFSHALALHTAGVLLALFEGQAGQEGQEYIRHMVRLAIMDALESLEVRRAHHTPKGKRIYNFFKRVPLPPILQDNGGTAAILSLRESDATLVPGILEVRKDAYVNLQDLLSAIGSQLVEDKSWLRQRCMFVLRASLTSLEIARKPSLHVVISAFIVASGFSLSFVERFLRAPIRSQAQDTILSTVTMMRSYLKNGYALFEKVLPEINFMAKSLGVKSRLAELEKGRAVVYPLSVSEYKNEKRTLIR